MREFGSLVSERNAVSTPSRHPVAASGPSRPRRVLIVDDSIVARRILSELIGGDPDLELAGTASDGAAALEKLSRLEPDIVTLDVEMPRMNGLETLARIRERAPELPVIMVSALTHRGAAATLDAIALGATDCVAKPAGIKDQAVARAAFAEQLLPRLRGLSGMRRRARAEPPPTATPAPPAKPVIQPASRPDRPIELVVIGVSTGGPNALAEVIPTLSPAITTPIVIVQHMPPTFTRLLAERLTAKSRIPVAEAIDGESLTVGRILLAPGDFHVTFESEAKGLRIRLNQEPPENSCRPAVDVTLRSAARKTGANTLAVILTGMGQDGLRGCELVRAAGGKVICQDEATSVVWGMPGFVARAGLADRVLPLPQIAPEINRLASKRNGS
jgi:two-component system chemotaxis response regulator CheB